MIVNKLSPGLFSFQFSSTRTARQFFVRMRYACKHTRIAGRDLQFDGVDVRGSEAIVYLASKPAELYASRLAKGIELGTDR